EKSSSTRAKFCVGSCGCSAEVVHNPTLGDERDDDGNLIAPRSGSVQNGRDAVSYHVVDGDAESLLTYPPTPHHRFPRLGFQISHIMGQQGHPYFSLSRNGSRHEAHAIGFTQKVVVVEFISPVTPPYGWAGLNHEVIAIIGKNLGKNC
ncbi:hypothetical protein DVH24_035749, partial [Malus domestica]